MNPNSRGATAGAAMRNEESVVKELEKTTDEDEAESWAGDEL